MLICQVSNPNWEGCLFHPCRFSLSFFCVYDANSGDIAHQLWRSCISTHEFSGRLVTLSMSTLDLLVSNTLQRFPSKCAAFATSPWGVCNLIFSCVNLEESPSQSRRGCQLCMFRMTTWHISRVSWGGF